MDNLINIVKLTSTDACKFQKVAFFLAFIYFYGFLWEHMQPTSPWLLPGAGQNLSSSEEAVVFGIAYPLQSVMLV